MDSIVTLNLEVQCQRNGILQNQKDLVSFYHQEEFILLDQVNILNKQHQCQQMVFIRLLNLETVDQIDLVKKLEIHFRLIKN